MSYAEPSRKLNPVVFGCKEAVYVAGNVALDDANPGIPECRALLRILWQILPAMDDLHVGKQCPEPGHPQVPWNRFAIKRAYEYRQSVALSLRLFNQIHMTLMYRQELAKY